MNNHTKHRVSGVPYMVELECLVHEVQSFNSVDSAVDHYEGIIATLEQENRQMRARMERLEMEVRLLEDINSKQNIELINLRCK